MELKVHYTTIGMKLCYISILASIFLTAIFGIDYRLVIVFLCCVIYLWVEERRKDKWTIIRYGLEIEKPEYKPKISRCRHMGMRIAMGKCRLRKGRR